MEVQEDWVVLEEDLVDQEDWEALEVALEVQVVLVDQEDPVLVVLEEALVNQDWEVQGGLGDKKEALVDREDWEVLEVLLELVDL